MKKKYVFLTFLVSLFGLLNLALIINYMIRMDVAANKFNTTSAQLIGGDYWFYLSIGNIALQVIGVILIILTMGAIAKEAFKKKEKVVTTYEQNPVTGATVKETTIEEETNSQI